MSNSKTDSIVLSHYDPLMKNLSMSTLPQNRLVKGGPCRGQLDHQTRFFRDKIDQFG